MLRNNSHKIYIALWNKNTKATLCWTNVVMHIISIVEQRNKRYISFYWNFILSTIKLMWCRCSMAIWNKNQQNHGQAWKYPSNFSDLIVPLSGTMHVLDKEIAYIHHWWINPKLIYILHIKHRFYWAATTPSAFLQTEHLMHALLWILICFKNRIKELHCAYKLSPHKSSIK